MSVRIGVGVAATLMAGLLFGPPGHAPSRPQTAVLVDSPGAPTYCDWTGDDPGACMDVQAPAACTTDAPDEPCQMIVEQAEVDCPGPPECSADADDPSPSPTALTVATFAAVADPPPLCDVRPGPGRCRLYEYTKEPRARLPRSGDSLIVDLNVKDPGPFQDDAKWVIDAAASVGATPTRLSLYGTVVAVRTVYVLPGVNVDIVSLGVRDVRLDLLWPDDGRPGGYGEGYDPPRIRTLVIVDR